MFEFFRKTGKSGIDSGADSNGSVLYNAYLENAASLYNYFYTRTGNEDSASELMQELAVKLATVKLPADMQDDNGLAKWIFGVAKNELRHFFRSAGRRAKNIPLISNVSSMELLKKMQAGPLPQKAAGNEENRKIVIIALTALPQKHQSVLTDFYINGKTAEQLATKMDLSVRAVEGRLYRAREALRKSLQHLQEDL